MSEELEQRRHPDREPERHPTEREAGSGSPETDEASGDEGDSKRMGPPQTTAVPETLEGGPTEDSPAREPTERIERLREEAEEEEDRTR